MGAVPFAALATLRLARVGAPGRMPGTMSAEYWIALDSAQAELGDLYTEARRYRHLADAAEAELLPALTAMGMRLRSLRRERAFDSGKIAAVAHEMHALRDAWLARMHDLRSSAPYTQLREAYAADEQTRVATLVPQVFVDLEAVAEARRIYFGVRVSAPRRRAGEPPFLHSEACVERVLERSAEGFKPAGMDEPSDAPGDALAMLACAVDPNDLDSPVSLTRIAAPGSLALFRRTHDDQAMLFSPHVRGPFSVALCHHWDDAWWESNPENYQEFRDNVAAHLRSQGVDVRIVGDGDDPQA